MVGPWHPAVMHSDFCAGRCAALKHVALYPFRDFSILASFKNLRVTLAQYLLCLQAERRIVYPGIPEFFVLTEYHHGRVFQRGAEPPLIPAYRVFRYFLFGNVLGDKGES